MLVKNGGCGAREADLCGMDEDDLFGVFSAKPAAGKVSAPAGSSVAVAAAGEGEAKKRRKQEVEEEDDDDDDAEGRPAVKRRETEGGGWGEGEELCPATGQGSVVVHNITEFNPELGRKAHRHQVAVPPTFTFEEVKKAAPPQAPAKQYSFELDPFQKASVQCLEKGQSVLVSAHTSAGKTAIAEYAIAMAVRDKQRVVYTSPIKALSNQKFRELTEEFQDVGLMTGDVTINPEASLLVMTTEILRSMLYKGSELIREVQWVIYDEIHYMRDRERGVVWEESIVLVPHKFRFVFLSATIPNAADFACWVARVHMQPVNVVYTDYRPTPLMHYMFPAGGDGLHLVVDQDGGFQEQNFHKCLAKLDTQQAATEIAAKQKGGKGGSKGKKDAKGADAYRIVKLIMAKDLFPAIAFAFGKKDVETLANQLKQLDFTTDDEKANIELIYNSAMDSLTEDDRKLPAVQSMLPLLKKGVGIHHGGLLPILKEVTEILFGDGLVKLLCATETFSMGLNMPAKTCIFTGVRKWDGEQFRWVSSGEYIQMSGRAGRRGLDSNGICIMMVEEKMDPQAAKGILMGMADALHSSFHLGYNMLLNLLRFEGADPEFLIRRSFYQFQQDKMRPEWEGKIEGLQLELKELVIEDEATVGEYHALCVELERLEEDVRSVVTAHKAFIGFLNPGRLFECTHSSGADWGWGVLVSFQTKDKGKGQPGRTVVDVLLPCAPPKLVITQTGQEIEVGDKNEDHTPATDEGSKVYQVVQLGLERIKRASGVRVFVPQDLRPLDSRKALGKTLQEVERRFADQGGVPILDPIEDMCIEDESFKKTMRRVEAVQGRIQAHRFHNSPGCEDALALYRKKVGIDNQIAGLRKDIKDSKGMAFRAELKGMKRVLRRLGFTSKDDVVEQKGRAACEIDTGDELVICELIYDGVFNDLKPEVCAALLSCFVFDEKSEVTENRLPDELQQPLKHLQDKARRVATVAQESKLQVDIDEYVDKFKIGLMEVTCRWCKGEKFADIIKGQDLFEGSVIRCIRRLEELVVQMSNVCKVIGNEDLGAKFLAASKMMKRDIVFAASLYL